MLAEIRRVRVKRAVSLGGRLCCLPGPVSNLRHVTVDACYSRLLHDAAVVHFLVWLHGRSGRSMTGFALALRCTRPGVDRGGLSQLEPIAIDAPLDRRVPAVARQATRRACCAMGALDEILPLHATGLGPIVGPEDLFVLSVASKQVDACGQIRIAG